MTALWSPGTAYVIGNLVAARSAPAVIQQDLLNADFEGGDVNWTKGTGWTIGTGGAYAGSYSAAKSSAAGTSILQNNNEVPVSGGQGIVASVALLTVGGATARVGIEWRDAAHAVLVREYGDVQSANQLSYRRASVSATAPSLGRYAVLIVEGTTTGGGLEQVRVDDASWNYAYVSIPNALLFEATVAGTSATTEPTWPTTVGGTVVDGTVTWTARAAARVTWTARPILKSGAVEPVWPAEIDALVADGSISWQAVTRRIESLRCPNSAQVTITASKVWAADGDIVRYCAVNNAKDWESPNDAGYLPTGLHQFGNNECSALNLYRGNLVVFSASTFQMWGVDEDPAANALIDTLEGIGTIYHLAVHPVSNDLFYLTSEGVRSVGIAASSTNLAAGDIGAPVDSIIRPEVNGSVENGFLPFGMFYPGAGQFWLVCQSVVFVYTMNRIGSVGSWSRYIFPYQVIGHCLLGNELYLLDHQGGLHLLDEETAFDQIVGNISIYFDGIVQWPHLDMGAPGRDKMMVGFDIVGEGVPTVQFGYDQRNEETLTEEYTVDPDTMPGDMIAMPLTAPTISTKITYKGAINSFWSLNAVNIYLADR